MRVSGGGWALRPATSGAKLPWNLGRGKETATMADTDIVQNAFSEAASALEALRKDEDTLAAVAAAGSVLAECFRNGGRAYSCGNGGSMCDAMHFAEELSGRFREDRPAFPAVAISDPGYLSCTANDFGYEQVFSRFVEAHGKAGDCLLAITTSGTSKNVVKAAEVARARNMTVIGLTGRRDGPLAELAKVHIATPCETKYADRVQELHIKVIHTLIELCENHLLEE